MIIRIIRLATMVFLAGMMFMLSGCHPLYGTTRNPFYDTLYKDELSKISIATQNSIIGAEINYRLSQLMPPRHQTKYKLQIETTDIQSPQIISTKGTIVAQNTGYFVKYQLIDLVTQKTLIDDNFTSSTSYTQFQSLYYAHQQDEFASITLAQDIARRIMFILTRFIRLQHPQPRLHHLKMQDGAYVPYIN